MPGAPRPSGDTAATSPLDNPGQRASPGARPRQWLALGVPPGSPLMVHASLLGRLIEGGAHAPQRPLREREDDIAPLAIALLRGIAARLGCSTPQLSANTLSRLLAHDWPGNVRELANVLETALVLGNGRALDLSVDSSIGARRVAKPRTTAAEVETLESATRRCIRTALAATDGRIYGQAGAANLLGLKPQTLQSKMRKLAIARKP
jgi:DNA-binding NtrC family response regulator